MEDHGDQEAMPSPWLGLYCRPREDTAFPIPSQRAAPALPLSQHALYPALTTQWQPIQLQSLQLPQASASTVSLSRFLSVSLRGKGTLKTPGHIRVPSLVASLPSKLWVSGLNILHPPAKPLDEQNKIGSQDQIHSKGLYAWPNPPPACILTA